MSQAEVAAEIDEESWIFVVYRSLWVERVKDPISVFSSSAY